MKPFHLLSIQLFHPFAYSTGCRDGLYVRIQLNIPSDGTEAVPSCGDTPTPPRFKLSCGFGEIGSKLSFAASQSYDQIVSIYVINSNTMSYHICYCLPWLMAISHIDS